MKEILLRLKRHRFFKWFFRSTAILLLLLVITFSVWFPRLIVIMTGHAEPGTKLSRVVNHIYHNFPTKVMFRSARMALSSRMDPDIRRRTLNYLVGYEYDDLLELEESIVTCLQSDNIEVVERACKLIDLKVFSTFAIEIELESMVEKGGHIGELARITQFNLDFPLPPYPDPEAKEKSYAYRNFEIIDDIFGDTNETSYQPIPSQKFNSEIEYSVFVLNRPFDLSGAPLVNIGSTPSEDHLNIPRCKYWFVLPKGEYDWQEIAIDLKQYKMPGLTMPNNATDDDLNAILSIVNLHSLQILNSSKISGVSLAELKNLDNLKILTFSGNTFGDDDIEHISKIISLEQLIINNVDITDAGLNNLGNLTNLKELFIIDCQSISDDGFGFLSELNSLESLMIVGSPIEGSMIKNLKEIPNFRRLMIQSCENVTDDFLKHLKGLQELQMLVLWDMEGVTNVSFQHIEKLLSLKLLSLADVKMTSTGFNQIETLHELRIIEFAHLDIDNSDMEYLKSIPQLQSIDIRGRRKVSDMGLEHLGEIKSIRSISLPESKITDDGLKYLERLENLKHLDLSRTIINGEGFYYLRGLDELQELNLWRTHIKDESLEHLKSLNNLQVLDISGTNITNAALRHIGEMKELKLLEMIWCNRLTEDGVEELRESLPDTHIRWAAF